jgi:hypothetical protein
LALPVLTICTRRFSSARRIVLVLELLLPETYGRQAPTIDVVDLDQEGFDRIRASL